MEDFPSGYYMYAAVNGHIVSDNHEVNRDCGLNDYINIICVSTCKTYMHYIPGAPQDISTEDNCVWEPELMQRDLQAEQDSVTEVERDMFTPLVELQMEKI